MGKVCTSVLFINYRNDRINDVHNLGRAGTRTVVGAGVCAGGRRVASAGVGTGRRWGAGMTSSAGVMGSEYHVKCGSDGEELGSGYHVECGRVGERV